MAVGSAGRSLCRGGRRLLVVVFGGLLRLERREELRLAAGVAGRERNGDEVLGLGDGAGASELDDVADLELVVGVVRLVLLLDTLSALVLGMRRQAHHLHAHRLVRLGRHHPPRQLPRRLDPEATAIPRLRLRRDPQRRGHQGGAQQHSTY